MSRRSFGFETTLASRTFVVRIERWLAAGYHVHLAFLWLPSADLAVARVRQRVQLGGHDVPEDTIRRRFARGLANFLDLYRPLVTTWAFYDNSGAKPRLVARGAGTKAAMVLDRKLWTRLAGP